MWALELEVRVVLENKPLNETVRFHYTSRTNL